MIDGNEFTETERKRLAKIILGMFDFWGLDSSQQAMLLGYSSINSSAINRLRKGHALSNRRDVIDRVSYCLGINRALVSLYPENPSVIKKWFLHKNPVLYGMSPIEIIELNGVVGLYWLRSFLEIQLQN